jgi:thiol-disulfide isomerase/thioredoxin
VRFERGARVVLPPFPFGPGRDPLTRRSRRLVTLVLTLGLAASVVVGGALLFGPRRVAPRLVTIPLADRSAATTLLRAAEAVGFQPTNGGADGQVEGASISASNPPSAAGLLPAGERAPGFTLRTPVGARVSLTRLRGKAVLLEFFATWCPHCDAEAPHLERLSLSLPPSRYALVAVNADGETAPSVLAYHVYFGLGFPALLDPSSLPGSFHSQGLPGKVSKAYRVGSYPTFYVVDPAGRVVWGAVGEQPDLLLKAELRRAARALP